MVDSNLELMQVKLHTLIFYCYYNKLALICWLTVVKFGARKIAQKAGYKLTCSRTTWTECHH